MAQLLENKIALITGGASGIGRAAALVFAREGAKILVADILAESGQETAALVRQAGGEATFVQCDVTQAAQVEALIDAAVANYGRLDCAFNNAGIEGQAAPTAECSEANWDRVVNINLKGVWLCMKYEIKQMLRQGGGAIVNTASVAALVAEPARCAYAAAKGGVVQLTRTAAIEYAKAGLRINAVCPGAIQTPMIDRALAEMKINTMSPGAIRSPLIERMANGLMGLRPVQAMFLGMMHPLGRAGKPEEIAQAAAWLCSDAASFITGHALTIDGGMTAQ